MSGDELFSRAEALAGGAPTRRARTLLYLIESRTAHLLGRARHATERFPTEQDAQDRELAFLEAYTNGREPRPRPSIQDLERFAAGWADLVPDGPRVRAAVAHAVGQTYRFTAETTPNLGAALGLDEPAVRQAYARLYGQPLSTIYARRVSPAARLRWVASRAAVWLESLPPFWSVFALTLTETVGMGILALPVAFAGIGPLAGLGLLVVLGLVNVLTMIGLAEAVTRTASVRYGDAHFRRMAAEYLGRAGSLMLAAVLVARCTIGLLGAYLGLSITLTEATEVPRVIWITVVFLAGLYVLSRGSLTSTIASALTVGAVNIGTIAILVLLAVPHLNRASLTHAEVPGVGGRSFDPSVLGLVFGVALSAYFGHGSVGNCGKVVLRRDPSGRALIWGAAAAQAAAIVIYGVWIVAINGALAPEALRGHEGTALDPLAEVAGPGVVLVGAIFVVLAMGMGSLHSALGLFNAAREWLPRRARPVVTLPRRRGRLLVQRPTDPTGPRLAVTYLGLAAPDGTQTRFRFHLLEGSAVAGETATVDGRWEARTGLARLAAARRFGVVFEVLDAREDRVQLRVVSNLAVSYEGDRTILGLQLGDLAAADGQEQGLLRWLLRADGASLAEVTMHLGRDETATRAVLAGLVARGMVEESNRDGTTYYGVRLARRRARAVPDALTGGPGTTTPAPRPTARRFGSGRDAAARLWDRLLEGERGRFLLATVPGLLIFLLAQWLAATDAAFTAVLNVGGVLAIPIFAGLFSALLLVSSRRKGDLVPAVVYRTLGHPAIQGAVYAFFLGAILAHGLVIWDDPFLRAGALIVAALAVTTTIDMVRRGMLRRRVVVSLRDDRQQGGPATFAVVAGGELTPTPVRLTYRAATTAVHAATDEVLDFGALRGVSFEVPAGGAADLKVWAQRIAADGSAEALPARLELGCGPEAIAVDVGQVGGQAMLPLAGEACRLDILLDDPVAVAVGGRSPNFG